jgi:hypothetical protein
LIDEQHGPLVFPSYRRYGKTPYFGVKSGQIKNKFMTANANGLSDCAIIVLLFLALIVLGFVFYTTRPNNDAVVEEPVGLSDIKVDLPAKNQEVSSPLAVSGKARGSWFFEAVFPVRIDDLDGNTISEGTARAAGDWMTSNFVMFDASLDFKVTEKQDAVLVLQNDNSSGLPENSKEYRVPIVLLPSLEDDFAKTGNLIQPDTGEAFWHLSYEEPGSPGLKLSLVIGEESRCVSGAVTAVCDTGKLVAGQRAEVAGKKVGDTVLVSVLTLLEPETDGEKKINLYYYDPELDKDASGNVLCSRRGLTSVERTIPATITPIQDAIKLLIEGALTEEERQRGVTTEYPLPGFSLKGAVLKNGILTLEFLDSENRTSGGSCRVGVLWFQIEATAKQFEGVKIVKPKPETLFQP